MKQVSGKLKLELAQYRELATFSQFGSDIDKDTKARLDHGKVLMEILKQRQYHPMAVEDQIISIYAASHGRHMEDIPPAEIHAFETALLDLYAQPVPGSRRKDSSERQAGCRNRKTVDRRDHKIKRGEISWLKRCVI